METSDDKRCEVAENLRCMTIGIPIQYKEQFFDELAEVVVGFEDYHDFNVVLEKLADLIDRPTCHLVEDEHGYTYCSECGFTAPCMLDASYCPECGARVVRDGD